METRSFVAKTFSLLFICMIAIVLSGCGKRMPVFTVKDMGREEKTSHFIENEKAEEKKDYNGIIYINSFEPSDETVTAFLQAASGTDVFLSKPIAQIGKDTKYIDVLVRNPADKDGNITYSVATMHYGKNEKDVSITAIYNCPLQMAYSDEIGEWREDAASISAAADVIHTVDFATASVDSGKYEPIACLAVKINVRSAYCVLARYTPMFPSEPQRYALLIVEEGLGDDATYVSGEYFTLAG